jgi:N-acetylneuraminic acid mutarotase
MRRRFFVLSLSLAACSSASTGLPLPTVGTWKYVAPGVGDPAGPGLEWAWTGSRLFAVGLTNAWQSDSPATQLDPATGVWTPASAAGAPSPRAYGFTAWTGTEVFVWSGEVSAGDLADGGLYAPATDSWRPLPAAPIAPRHLGTAVWTGALVIVWGGQSHDSANNIVTFNDGARFDPVAGAWSPVSTSGAPRAMSQHAAVWTGSRMIVWDGVSNGAGAYDPVSDSWTAISPAGGPSPRNYSAAVWTGTEMIVLGGQCVGDYCRDGGRYDPATESWKRFDIPAPGGYIAARSAAWTGDRLLTWGWVPSGGGWGGIYDPRTDSWEQMASAPSDLVGRVPDVVAWTGSSAIVYGGQINDALFADGAIFTP